MELQERIDLFASTSAILLDQLIELNALRQQVLQAETATKSQSLKSEPTKITQRASGK